MYSIYLYYMSHQYRNKSKSQLTSPTPAQLPAVAVSSGHIVYVQGVPLHMGFVVKNPSKRSVSLKNELEGKKVKIQCQFFNFKRV
jgi:hypothetical protein